MAYAPFVPLRVLSSYSMLEGAIDPKAIARLARERGLTDPSLEALIASLTEEERKAVSERASTWRTGFIR